MPKITWGWLRLMVLAVGLSLLTLRTICHSLRFDRWKLRAAWHDLGGIILLAAAIFGISLTPIATLTNVLGKVPVLGEILGISIFLMIAGIAWSLININSLPMVVDMTSIERIGTFTGLYYLFSNTIAILVLITNGLMIDLTGGNYNAVMSLAPITLLIALVLISGVKRGEAQTV